MANITALYFIAICVQMTVSERFASHVTVNTPARSFTHGVGDPISVQRRSYQYRNTPKYSSIPPRLSLNSGTRGYPRIRPYIPFDVEEFSYRPNSIPTQHRGFSETTIPVLPVSPYKIDSPDPESLWPEGLFLPPRFGFRQPTDDEVETGNISCLLTNDGRWITKDAVDPFLLEGSEAIAAVTRTKTHGIYWFHDIPHINSLLTNQEIRRRNHLEPNRIGSIRHTWPFNRP